MRTASIIVLLLALVATACGGADQAAGRADDQAVQAPGGGELDPDAPVPDAGDLDLPPTDDDGATRLALPAPREVRDGVRDATPRPFERALSDETDGSLHVVYWTGVEPCAVLGDIEVVAGSDQVTVTLLEGYLPDDGAQPTCQEIAEEVSVRVPLDEPLGDRTLLDGATGEPVPVDVVKMSDAAAG